MKNKFNKKIIIIVGIALLLCVVAISVAIAVGGNRKNSVAQMLELGARYLSELDYENAIVAYEAAIEIEPMNEDAYLGLAEVYVAMGDTNKALEVLAEGYAQTESERIAQRQEELEQELAQELAQAQQEEEQRQAGESLAEESKPEEEPLPTAPPVTFIPWEEVGLEDHVMDWKDRWVRQSIYEAFWRYADDSRMDKYYEGDKYIMLSDLWEIEELSIIFYPGFSEGDEDVSSDISLIGELKNLRELHLEADDQINDISAIGELTNLTYLNLSCSEVGDISVIGELTNLKELILYTQSGWCVPAARSAAPSGAGR